MKRFPVVLAVLGVALSSALAADVTPKQAKGVEDKAVQQINEQITKANVDKSNAGWRTSLPKPTAVSFDPKHTYYALMQTNKGPIKIKLLPAAAPMHVTSFIYLADLGYFDGLSFHRVIPGFMAQGGDPLGNGMGGPGYKFDGEFNAGLSHNKPGLLSQANAGPGTDGSQFFLTFVPTPFLDGKHTIYGEIVEGMDTMKKLEAVGSATGKTSEPLKIETVTIEVK